MYNERCVFIGGIFPDIFHPGFVAFGVEYFGIRNMDVLMRSVFANTRVISQKAEIVPIRPGVYLMIVFVECLVSRWGGDKDKSLAGVSGQCVRSVFRRFRYIQSVRHFDASQCLLSTVKLPVAVLVNKHAAVVCSSCARGSGQ